MQRKALKTHEKMIEKVNFFSIIPVRKYHRMYTREQGT